MTKHLQSIWTKNGIIKPYCRSKYMRKKDFKEINYYEKMYTYLAIIFFSC